MGINMGIKFKAIGLFAILTILGTSLSFNKASAAGAFVTLNKFSGNAGAVLVSGGGYSNGETVNIYLKNPSGTPVATATAGTNSLFGPVSVTIPANTAQGNINIIAIGATSQLQATNAYFVVPFSPVITVTSNTNTPLSTITLNGSGFAPGESINLALANATSTVTADSGGAFTDASIVIPAVASNVYILKADGQNSAAEATAFVFIGGFFPSVTPATYYILPGQTLNFSGSGFASNEPVNIFEAAGQTPLKTFNTDQSGNFSAAGNIIIPFNLAGTSQTFSFVGTESHVQTNTTVTVGQFFPSVFPSTYYLNAGQTLTFSGAEFAPGEPVNITAGNNNTVLGTFTTDQSGSYKNVGSVTVPFSLAGTSPIFKLKGSQSGGEADVTITIAPFFPQLSPATYYIHPGETLNLSGDGFAPHEIVDLTAGTTTVKVTTDAEGNFAAAAFKVPFSSQTNLTITATGETSHANTTVNITLAMFFPSAIPSSYYLMPGGSISFSGSGFAQNENVNISLGQTLIGTATADNLGNVITGNFTIAANAAGSSTYALSGAASNATASVTVTIAALKANISADNYYALPGSIVHITGTGFISGETVNITAGAFSTNQTADNTGAIASTAVKIPFGIKTPSIDIVASGASSHTSAHATITLAPFMPQVIPSSYFIAPGSQISFSGGGFAPGETVQYTFNGNGPGLTTADSLGNIKTGALTIPVNTVGNAHYIFTGLLSNQLVAIDIGLSAFNAGIQLSSYYGQGGIPETITGAGFAPGESVAIDFGGNALGPVTTDANGAFQLATNVPFAASGNKIVRATGHDSLAFASATFTQAPVFVSIQLQAYAGKPGTAIDFIGTGYLPNEPVNITTDRTGSTIVHTFNADSSGNFNDSGYMIPNDFTEGTLQLTITGAHSLNPQSIIYFVVHP